MTLTENNIHNISTSVKIEHTMLLGHKLTLQINHF